MSSRSGCFKPVLFGCLGLLGVVGLIVVISLAVAWRGVSQQELVDRELSAPLPGAAAPAAAAEPVLLTRKPGRVILELGQGEFTISPADSGEGLVVISRFDPDAFELTEHHEILPDSSWVYRVRYRRSIGALQALARQIVGGQTASRLEVRLPPELPLSLEVVIRQGGAEVDLGGLWLREASLACHQGGLALDVSSPLHEPLATLALTGRMGGIAVTRLGNASPGVLAIDCAMGGADVGLGGAWRTDCHARATVRMGGINIRVPENLAVRDAAEAGLAPPAAALETATPTLWLETSSRMGEVEVQRR
jgi:hypothetical protein